MYKHYWDSGWSLRFRENYLKIFIDSYFFGDKDDTNKFGQVGKLYQRPHLDVFFALDTDNSIFLHWPKKRSS